jgi:SAM-dependent methyltransferase
MATPSGNVRLVLELSQPPAEAFATLLDELELVLAPHGLLLELGQDGRALEGSDEIGRVLEGTAEVGRVVAWEPGARMRLAWQGAPWAAAAPATLELRAEPVDGGARVTVELGDWGAAIGDAGDLLGWFAGAAAGPLLRSAAPAALGDWITDRRARRPSGPSARAIYRDPLYHYPNFRVLLSELALTPADDLIEVACGGGAFLRQALASGCRAVAIDHSPDMVRVARAANREAIAEGRLEIVEGRAESLPFPAGRFTCGAMTGVFGFLADPVAALRELRRVLRPGGRIVVQGTDPENRGTPAAPEPMASRLKFYDEREMEELARAAGFAEVRVVRRELAQYARDAGVPQEHLPLFEGPGSRFLLARKA